MAVAKALDPNPGWEWVGWTKATVSGVLWGGCLSVRNGWIVAVVDVVVDVVIWRCMWWWIEARFNGSAQVLFNSLAVRAHTPKDIASALRGAVLFVETR